MCYSAMIWDEYRKYLRLLGAEISIEDYVRIYWARTQGASVRTPKGMDVAFCADPDTDAKRRIADLIREGERNEAARLETELFAQRKRLADANRSLQNKATKKAAEDQRIASNKVDQGLRRLSDLRRVDRQPRDARIYPGWYAHVLVSEAGRRVLKPMRYRCRLPGWNEAVERKFPGTYMARRDKLRETWCRLYGHSHGVLVLTSFFEIVERSGSDGKPAKVELEFRPQSSEPMLVACLWSRVPTPEGDLLSFAAISDEPPPEILAAGHDRCPVPIRAAHLDAWLNPNPRDLASMDAILEDRQRPTYAHRLAEVA